MRRRINGQLDRRALVKAFGACAGALGAGRLGLLGAAAEPVPAPLPEAETSYLGPGEFFWRSDQANDGPLVIFASIPKQLVYVYRKGLLVGLSTCSTGMPGHSTPAGRFSVINKMKVHRSATYGDDMPDTLRLTKKGVALHGGDVPGYPVSHGCVHLPLSFADGLFDMTDLGTPVIIGGHDEHHLVAGPGTTPAANAGNIVAARQAARSLAPTGTDADTSILISSADRRIYVVQDGTILAAAPASIEDPEQPLGTNVFAWRDGEPGGTAPLWQAHSFAPVPGGATVEDARLLERVTASPKATQAIDLAMHSGTVVLTTDEPLSRVADSETVPVAEHRRGGGRRHKAKIRVKAKSKAKSTRKSSAPSGRRRRRTS